MGYGEYVEALREFEFRRLARLEEDWSRGVIPEPVYMSLRAEYLTNIFGFFGETPPSRRPPLPTRMKRFFLKDFPTAVTAVILYVFISALVFTLGVHHGFLFSNPEEFQRLFGSLRSSIPIVPNPIAEGFVIYLHNLATFTSVSTLGIGLGVIPIISLFINGEFVGISLNAYIYLGRGSYLFLSLILPHGVLELSAFFIAVGAGMEMGVRLFRGGGLPLSYRVFESARNFSNAVSGSVVMIFISAFIESCVSPSPLLTPTQKIYLSITELAILILYIFLTRWMGRE